MRKDILNAVGFLGSCGMIIMANVFVGLFLGKLVDSYIGGCIFTIGLTLLGSFTGLRSVCKMALKK